MRNIPVNAKVECTDGTAGESTNIIINPTTRQVTHFVVQDKHSPSLTERLVPIEHVAETSSDLIRLSCTLAELGQMEPFSEMHYIRNEISDYDAVMMQPYATAEMKYIPIEEQRIPPGELAVRRGTSVEATDGYVGKVGELLLDPESGQITHLVLLEGHLWGKKVVTLPLSAVDRVEDEAVYLNLDKESVEALPAIPVKRYYGLPKGGTVEVIAAIYDNSAQAEENKEFLKGLHRQKILKLRNLAVLTKDQDGNTSIDESDDVNPRQGAIFGAITGGLIGLMAGPVGAIVGAAAGAGTGGWAAGKIDMGFPDKSLQEIENSLQPGGAALLALIEHEYYVNLSEVLADIKGLLFLESLTDEMIEQLEAEEK